MAKKPSQAFVAAKAALLEILGDGQQHEICEIMNELERRGIDFKAAQRAEEQLGIIYFSWADEETHTLHPQYWRLPRVMRPAKTPLWVWTIELLVKLFTTQRERRSLEVIDEATEHQIPVWCLFDAMHALGIVSEWRVIDDKPADFWVWPQCPIDPALCVNCHKEPRLPDFQRCATCQPIFEKHWWLA